MWPWSRAVARVHCMPFACADVRAVAACSTFYVYVLPVPYLHRNNTVGQLFTASQLNLQSPRLCIEINTRREMVAPRRSQIWEGHYPWYDVGCEWGISRDTAGDMSGAFPMIRRGIWEGHYPWCNVGYEYGISSDTEGHMSRILPVIRLGNMKDITRASSERCECDICLRLLLGNH